MKTHRLLMPLFFAALSSPAVPSVTNAEAVQDAMIVENPAYGDIIAEAGRDPSAVLGAVGSASVEGLDAQTGLFQDGMGALYAPAVTTVIGCRTADDPTCRAVQILDKGFPERPPISDDVLLGRDEVVDSAGTPTDPGVDVKPGACTDVTLGAPSVTTTETCRAGGWFEDVACRVGPVESGTVEAKYFGCSVREAESEKKTCLIPVSMSSTVDWYERCWFGAEALAPSYTVRETTTAAASALYPVTCRAPQASVEEVACSEIRYVKKDPGCEAGSKTTVTVTGGSELTNDVCPDGDTLTVSHVCGSMSSLQMGLNSYRTLTVSKGQTTAPQRHPSNSACRASYQFKSASCTSDACTATALVTVRYGNTKLGSITARLTYKNETENEVVYWEDGCKGLKDESAKESAAARSASGRTSP